MNGVKFIFWSTLVFMAGIVVFDYNPNRSTAAIKPQPDVFIDYVVPDGNMPYWESPGGKLFQTQCTSCHSIDRELIGPPLAGVRNRYPDSRKLYKFVRNGAAVVKSGDPYGVALAAKYGGIVHPRYNLSDAQIDSILDYVSVVGVW